MIKKVINILLIIILFAMSHYILAAPSVQAEGAVLIEGKTNTVLYEKNANEKFYPASITKILTALIVEEQLPDNTVIYKSQNSIINVPADSSHIGVEVGDSYTKADGLYGLLLGSDNFIAYDMAVKVAGNIPDFAALMNQKAREAGALNTHFTNPHGYHDTSHYTTPFDMAEIARMAFSNDVIQKTAGTRRYNFKINNKQQSLVINNSSRLLKSETPYYNPNVIACKTGFHDDAKQTLVAKARYGDMELIAVVMKVDTPNQYMDVNNLLEYGNSHFNVEKINGVYQLENKTMSRWSRPIIQAAIDEGWYKEEGQDYKEAVDIEELVVLLKRLGLKYGQVTMKEIEALTGLKEGQPVNREEAAQIMTYVLKKWKIEKMILSNDPFIPDSSQISADKREAVLYTIKRGILGAGSQKFRPYDNLCREEAVCMLYKTIH